MAGSTRPCAAAEMGDRLEGRVAIVTGAAGGIGAAIMRRMLADGASAVAADLDVEGLKRLSESLEGSRRCLSVAADVTSEESCANLIAAVERAYGRIDIVVNNAGLYPSQRFEEITYEQWRRVIAVNLDGAFLVSRCAVPIMKSGGWGRIINISSGTVWHGTATFTHYAAAKAGIIGFTRSLASELGEFGITVNAVSPGLTVTDTVLKSISGELLETRRLQRPLRRHQVAEDVVGAIAFLASDDAGFITGQTINVDGGLAMR
ncbi:MAG: SDR family NAD(P)-dependent oxidoreductase [Alphaproteobacteria bacterium]